VCTGCSSNKATLPNIPDQRVRICDLCMEGQKKNPSGDGESSSPQSPQPVAKKKSISGPKDGRPLGSANPSATPVPAERKKIPVDSDDSSSDGEEVTEVEEDGAIAFKSRISFIDGSVLPTNTISQQQQQQPKAPPRGGRRKQFKKADSAEDNDAVNGDEEEDDEKAGQKTRSPQTPSSPGESSLPVAPPRRKKEGDSAPEATEAVEPIPVLPPRNKTSSSGSSSDGLKAMEQLSVSEATGGAENLAAADAGGEQKSGGGARATARRRKFKKAEEGGGGEEGGQDQE